MKKIITAVVALGLIASPSYASDLEASCEAYAAENGTDGSGCGCLAETADASVTEELLTVASEADLEGLSDAAKEAIGTCFPDAG